MKRSSLEDLRRLCPAFLGSILGILSVFLLSGFIAVHPVQASEGTAILNGNNNVRCFAGSVLISADSYQIIVSCRNLLIPPSTNRLFYHVWAHRIAPSVGGVKAPLGNLVHSDYLSLGDISTGKLAARTREAFNEVIVTSEEAAQPRTPSLDRIIAPGAMKPLEIDLTPTPGPGGTAQATVAPASQVTIAPTVTPAGTPRTTAKSGSVIGTAIRVFLVVLGVIVIVAIVISVVQRRSAS